MNFRIKKGKWPIGETPDPIEYVKLAALYVETVYDRGNYKTNLILAAYYEVPCSVIKERIKKCREMGLLTYPGKGVIGRSSMTYKAVEMLREARLVG
jgi:predicted transcriptional regulator